MGSEMCIRDSATGQYYLEAPDMWTRDHLRLVLNDEKLFLKRSVLKTIEVPPYDELSVHNLWPNVKDNADILKYMPDKMAKGGQARAAPAFSRQCSERALMRRDAAPGAARK